MQLRDMFLSCLRRWYFVAAGLLLTGAATYAVFTSVHPTFDSKASVVLIPPKVAVTTGDNPYLYLGGLDQAIGVLQVKVSSPEVSGDLVKRYPGGVLTVTRDATTTGPILSITATADDAASSLKLLQSAEDLVPTTLATLQAQLRVPADSVITSMKLSEDVTPAKVDKKQVQTTAMVGVGGAAATIILVGLLDRLLSRRGQRRVEEAVETALKAETKRQAEAERDAEAERRAEVERTAETGREAEAARTAGLGNEAEPDDEDLGDEALEATDNTTVSLFRERSTSRSRPRRPAAW